MSFKEKMMTSSSTFAFTAEDRAQAERKDEADLASNDRPRTVLVSGPSPELVPDHRRYIRGAMIGDFVVPQGDERLVFRGETGYDFILLGFDVNYTEYAPGRGPFIRDHGRIKPPEAVFLDPKRGDNIDKAGHYMRSGNRIEETIHCFNLVNGFLCVYDFARTALKTCREFADRARRIKATVPCDDGKPVAVKGYLAAKWKMSSAIVKDGEFRYPTPVLTLAGKLGESNGPSLEEWRRANVARLAFKAGELDWTPIEAPEPPAPPSETAPTALPQGTYKNTWTLEPTPPTEQGKPAPKPISERKLDESWDDEPPPVTDYDGPG
jgi:hypothetical protein